MSGSLQNYFNSTAHTRKNRHWLNRYYWKEITSYCDYFSHEDFSVLEIGCGAGDLLAGIKAGKRTGIDFSEEIIKAAREKHPGIDFHLMPAENISLTEKSEKRKF